MDPSSIDADATARIRALLAAERLDASYLAFVARHATEPDASWRWCCGSHCDPCVERLGRVVDAARRVLGVAPNASPGMPAGGQTQ
ncbi:MAG TPA: hypothetical protein VFZ65_02970 [Planctomycetota bacterium]|nr:hypothetical protein [Planctomycetota bacterium]